MQQRIISTDKGLSVITVRGDSERRIELSLDDCGDFIELRIGRNRNVTDTMAVTPDLARAVYDWLGKWLDAQDGEPPAKPYDPYIWIGPTVDAKGNVVGADSLKDWPNI